LDEGALVLHVWSDLVFDRRLAMAALDSKESDDGKSDGRHLFLHVALLRVDLSRTSE
jgi:hypothetical protein